MKVKLQNLLKITLAIWIGMWCFFTWSPVSASNETLSASKDAYVSVYGGLSDPSANYGLAEYITVGAGFDGVCVGIITFDLSDVPDNTQVHFQCGGITFGQETRTIKVFEFQDIVWDETEITGLNNPFGALELCQLSSNDANVTVLTLGGSADEISFSFYPNFQGEYTLVFAPDLNTSVWMELYSKDNSYSWVDKPTLSYELTSSNQDGGNLFSVWLYLGSLAFVGLGIYLGSRKKKQKTYQSYSRAPPMRGYPHPSQTSYRPPANYPPPQNTYRSPTIQCPFCGEHLPAGTKFCSSCGRKL